MEERADALTRNLWTYRDDSFLPHATWRVGDAAEQPIVLTAGEGNPNRANGQVPGRQRALAGRFGELQRLVLVFNGDDSDALAAAPAPGTDCKTRGSRLLLAGRRARTVAAAAIAIEAIAIVAVNDKLWFRRPLAHSHVMPQSGGGQALKPGSGTHSSCETTTLIRKPLLHCFWWLPRGGLRGRGRYVFVRSLSKDAEWFSRTGG